MRLIQHTNGSDKAHQDYGNPDALFGFVKRRYKKDT